MGFREWAILVRSREDFDMVLDAVEQHNKVVAEGPFSENPHNIPVGETILYGAILRFKGGIYVVLAAYGGGMAITDFLEASLPFPCDHSGTEEWYAAHDYLWKKQGGDLREDDAPGTPLHKLLSNNFADPYPLEWQLAFFEPEDTQNIVKNGNESFYDIMGISKRYLAGEGVALVGTDPATAVPSITASLVELRELNRLGFVFVEIQSDAMGSERRLESLRMLCRDADARDVDTILFGSTNLRASIVLSEKKNVDWCDYRYGSILRHKFGFQDAHSALVGVAELIVKTIIQENSKMFVSNQMLCLAKKIRAKQQKWEYSVPTSP